MPPARTLRLAALSITATSIAACSSPRPQAVVPLLDTPLRVDATDPEFPAAPLILSGYDLAPSAEAWRSGDKVLLGIRLDRPGVLTTRMVLVELLDAHNPSPCLAFSASPVGRAPYRIESGVYYTRLTLFDADGAVLKSGVGEFPDRIMGHGVYDGAEPAVDRPRTPTGGVDTTGISDAQYEQELLGWLSVMSFSTSLGKNGMFTSMARHIIARPSLLTMLLNPDVSLGVGDTFGIHRRHWRPAGHDPIDGVTLPLTCSISNKLAAVARIHAVRPVAPLGLTAGIVSIHGYNADKPDVRFEVRLLAARRGDADRPFTTVAAPPTQ